MANILEALPVLRAARLVFERAGNKSLVASCEELIADALEESRLELRQARRDEAIRRSEGVH